MAAGRTGPDIVQAAGIDPETAREFRATGLAIRATDLGIQAIGQGARAIGLAIRSIGRVAPVIVQDFAVARCG